MGVVFERGQWRLVGLVFHTMADPRRVDFKRGRKLGFVDGSVGFAEHPLETAHLVQGVEGNVIFWIGITDGLHRAWHHAGLKNELLQRIEA